MRSIVFRYDDISGLASALEETRGSLPLPRGESVLDGEWVLVLFEIGSRKRATATAARGVRAAGDPHIEFEPRDWDRLQAFVAARCDAPRSMRNPPSTSFPVARPAGEARSDEEGPRSALPIESSRVPAGAKILLLAPCEPGAATVRETVSAVLSEIGLAVDVVASVEQANARLTATSFDAVVVDGHVQTADPLELVRALRRDRACVPVLLLSDRASSRELVEAFACGADDFLPKPFRPSELGARVFGLLRRTRLSPSTVHGENV